MFIRLSFVTLILAVVALGTPVKRDAAQVELDIQNMDKQSKSLDKSIKAFPSSGGTIFQAFAIRDAFTNLESFVKTATNDASASAVFTDAQANTILGEVENHLSLHVNKALEHLVVKKHAVSALDMISTTKSGLQDLKTATDAFGKALLAKTPADTQSNVQDQFSTMDATFSSAIDAYST